MNGTSAEKERSQIAGRAGVVALGTLVSRLLGLGRDMALAAFFSRAATDAWLIAWQLPNLLRQVLAEGAVQTAVLPVLSEIRERDGEDAAKRFFRAISGFFTCILVLASLLGVIFARRLAVMFASGFKARPEQLALTVELTEWVFPYIFFMGASSLGVAALNTHRRFVVTSFAPALLNIAFLAAAIALPGFLGARGYDAIFAMAIGGLAGGTMQVIAQWPSLKQIGYLALPSFELTHPGIAVCLNRLAPTLLGIGVYAIDVMIGRRMLSELAEGSVTYFTYALRLCDFSQGIFVMALSSATLPSLSTFVARGQLEEVSTTLAYSLRLSLFVGFAATFASLALAGPLVSTVFERGQFSPQDSLETTRAFVAQGVGIFLVAGVRQLVIVFFALGRTKVPVYVAMVDILVFAGVGMALRDELGHVGISWAVTAARTAQFGLLWWALHRYLPPLPLREIAVSAARHLTAGLIGATLAFLSLRIVPDFESGGSWTPLLRLVIGATAFGFGFFPCAHRLKSEELRSVIGPLRRRLGLGKK